MNTTVDKNETKPRKKIKISFNAPVTLIFSAMCLVATILGLLSDGAITRTVFMIYHSSIRNPMTYIRLFSHVLGHSGWLHFIGNISYILLLGPHLEEKYGSVVLVETIGITALVTGIIHYAFFLNIGLCGASGVVFAFILLSSFASMKEGEIPITFILIAVIYIGQELYNGLFVKDNISQLGHIIGGIVGSVIGFTLNKKTAKKASV